VQLLYSSRLVESPCEYKLARRRDQFCVKLDMLPEERQDGTVLNNRGAPQLLDAPDCAARCEGEGRVSVRSTGGST